LTANGVDSLWSVNFGIRVHSSETLNAQLARHSHQVRQRIGAHFGHHLLTVNLDGNFAYLQFCFNLLIKQSGNYLLHDFLAPLAGTLIAFDSLFNRP
jgi:hypothetical protein